MFRGEKMLSILSLLSTVVIVSSTFNLYKLDEGKSFNAVSLDGTPAAFYFQEGIGDDWVFYFQGGGCK